MINPDDIESASGGCGGWGWHNMMKNEVHYTVEIVGNGWSGYWVVSYADGREEVRVGPFRNKRQAREAIEQRLKREPPTSG